MEPGGRIVLQRRRARTPTAVITRAGQRHRHPAPSIVSRIFDLFTQVHRQPATAPRAARHRPGAGPAARRDARRHRGRPQRGPRPAAPRSCVRLPLIGAQCQPTRPVAGRRGRAAPPQRAARRRILVADDNRDAAEALALRLELAGHEVRTAHDGLEALAVAATLRPEVVLLDLGMPGMDGYETARRHPPAGLGQEARLSIALTGWGQRRIGSAPPRPASTRIW